MSVRRFPIVDGLCGRPVPTPAQLRAYLERRRWKHVATLGHWETWEREDGVGVDLPLREEARDYPGVVRDLLQDLGRLEGRLPGEVLGEVLGEAEYRSDLLDLAHYTTHAVAWGASSAELWSLARAWQSVSLQLGWAAHRRARAEAAAGEES